MLSRGTSRSGRPILFHDGKPLHSTYDPVREAQRFSRSVLAGAGETAVVVLVGAAMGYVESALSEERPRARLLRVFLDSGIAVIASGADPAPGWHPGLARSLSSFLAAWIDESDLTALRVVEWAPSVAAFPAQARLAGGEIRAFVQRLRANHATTTAFGWLWVRNALANFVGLKGLSPPAAAADPLLIAASGPSLAEALPAVLRGRDRLRLWALPSAVRPLRSAGAQPDLIVATDPGLYALQHLDRRSDVPIAMPLAAARGSWSFADSVQLFAQPYLFERDLAARITSWPLPVIPPQGTVAASALQLALALGHRTIVFAGLDFCYRDVLSHARPSLVEIYHGSRAGRLSPFDGALFSSAAEAAGGAPSRGSAPLLMYAQWFASAAVPAGARVFRLLPSPVPVPSLVSLDPGGLQELLPRSAAPWSAPQPVPLRPGRADAALAAIDGWRQQLEAARGRRPSEWTPLARELCHFLDLPAYAAAKGGGTARTLVDLPLSLLADLRAKIAAQGESERSPAPAAGRSRP